MPDKAEAVLLACCGGADGAVPPSSGGGSPEEPNSTEAAAASTRPKRRAAAAAHAVKQAAAAAVEKPRPGELRRGVPNALALMEQDFQMISSLRASQQNFVLTNPAAPSDPIVYASAGFLELTGHAAASVVGVSLKQLLAGPGTDPTSLEILDNNLADGAGRETSLCLLSYRADGSPVWMQLYVGALRDSGGRVVNHVACMSEVTALPPTEFHRRLHRVPLPQDLLEEAGASHTGGGVSHTGGSGVSHVSGGGVSHTGGGVSHTGGVSHVSGGGGAGALHMAAAASAAAQHYSSSEAPAAEQQHQQHGTHMLSNQQQHHRHRHCQHHSNTSNSSNNDAVMRDALPPQQSHVSALSKLSSVHSLPPVAAAANTNFNFGFNNTSSGLSSHTSSVPPYYSLAIGQDLSNNSSSSGVRIVSAADAAATALDDDGQGDGYSSSDGGAHDAGNDDGGKPPAVDPLRRTRSSSSSARATCY